MRKYSKRIQVSEKLPAWIVSKLKYLARKKGISLSSPHFRSFVKHRGYDFSKAKNKKGLSRMEKNFLRKLEKSIRRERFDHLHFRDEPEEVVETKPATVEVRSEVIHFEVEVEFTHRGLRQNVETTACFSAVLGSNNYPEQLFVKSSTDINDVTCMNCMSVPMPPPR